jgi:hypothetical protein
VIEVKGTVGSMHLVRLVLGAREATSPVLVTEGGAVPRRVELPDAPVAPIPAKKPDTSASHPAVAPTASSPGEPVSRKME